MPAIGEVARRTGLKIPTIRFYEAEGLIDPPDRSLGGRRLYSESDVRRLAFVRHARTLGFELADIRSLLELSASPDRPCAHADEIAKAHLIEVEARIEQLEALRRELARIVRSCAGGRAATCRVIEALADHASCEHEHEPARPKQTRKKKAVRRR